MDMRSATPLQPPSGNTPCSAPTVSSGRAGLGSLITDDLQKNSHQIPSTVFLDTFLKVNQDFVEHCTRIFSLKDDSIASPEWRTTVQGAIDDYKMAAKELDQCAPFLRIIDAILDRAENEEFRYAFPQFKRDALRYTVQSTQAAKGQVETAGRSPDILGQATIEGNPDAPASWTRALLPLEFRMNTREDITDDGQFVHEEGSQSSATMPDLNLAEEYVVTSETLTSSNRGKKRTPIESCRSSIKRLKTSQLEARQPIFDEWLALYCSKMFSTGLRVHAYGAIIENGKMTLHHIDCDGRVFTYPFDIFKHWGMLTAVIVAFSSLDAQQWGFYPFLEWDTSRCLIPLVDDADNLGLKHPTLLLWCEKEVLEEYRLDRQDETTAVEELLDLGKLPHFLPSTLSDIINTEPGQAKVTLTETIYARSGLGGRGTTLFRIQQDDRPGPRDIIIKIGSQPTQQLPERLYLRYAKEGLNDINSPCVQSLPILVGWAQGLRLSNGPRGGLPDAGRIGKDDTADRIIHALAFPYYDHIYTLKTEEEFESAMRDCVNCSRALYEELQLLHRDISSENLMWDPYLKRGVLNDFDLAKLVAEIQNGPSSKYRTGTLPFIAIDLLRGRGGEHLFRFDLESFLYVIMWIVARYEDGKEKYNNTLGDWLSKNPDVVRKDKWEVVTGFTASSNGPWKNSKTYPTVYDSWIGPLLQLFDQFFIDRRLFERRRSPANYTEESASRRLIEEFMDILNPKGKKDV